LNFKSTIEFIKALYPNKGFIPLHEPKFVGNEKKYVVETIESTFVSSVGEFVNKFEHEIASITGAKYAVAIVNGTSALHLALKCAGVQNNDLVITQSLSFIATTNAINYLGAEPVFIDVDLQTMGLCPIALQNWLLSETELKINKETGRKECIHIESQKKISAVVPMHTFGHPCVIDEIQTICETYQIPLIEDAAESIGSQYKNKHTGTFGLAGVFSFNGNKTITCGGGGAIITNDETFAKMAKHLSTQAKLPHKWEFNHDMVGYNYRMPNINAALACAQLEQLNVFIENKRELALIYNNFFEKTEDIIYKSEPIHSKSNYWLHTIQLMDLEQRNLFLTETNDNGVMTRPTWTPTHLLPMYKNAICGDLKNTIFLADRLVNISSSVRV
jgi:aminotransferase in exopolysaccharide biosynthesis